MRLSWHDLGTQRADRQDGRMIEVAGWPVTFPPSKAAGYFLLTPSMSCCVGCLPRHPLTTIEVFADSDIDLTGGTLRLSGTLHISSDPEGWRYQLEGARRSEEHTSELQSHSDLVCRLLLEKK